MIKCEISSSLNWANTSLSLLILSVAALGFYVFLCQYSCISSVAPTLGYSIHQSVSFLPLPTASNSLNTNCRKAKDICLAKPFIFHSSTVQFAILCFESSTKETATLMPGASPSSTFFLPEGNISPKCSVCDCDVLRICDSNV